MVITASSQHDPSPTTVSLPVFCACDLVPGAFHGILPGRCPGTFTESGDGVRVTLLPGDAPGTLPVLTSPPPGPNPANPDGTVTLLPIPKAVNGSTQEVIEDLRRHFRHLGLKPSTVATYEKRWRQFEKAFPLLPTSTNPLLEYLAQFDGPTARHRRNHHEAVKRLLDHACKVMSVIQSNPLDRVPRPRIHHRPITTLSIQDVASVNALPMTLRQRVVWDLLAGHGWRQVEVLRITAGDVRMANHGSIWCRGKVRDEWAPILPETLARLIELAEDVPDAGAVIRSRQATSASYDTLRRTVRDLLGQLGLSIEIHGLRRTFATIATELSGDEVLAMRLIRDRVPGVGRFYVERQLPALLARFSPLRLGINFPETKAPGEPPPSETPATVLGGPGGSARGSNPPGTGIPAPQRF